MTYAVRDGRELIAVVLKGSQPQYYLDSKNLIEFGFANFQNLYIAENETAYTTGEEPVAVGESQYQPSDLYLQEDAQITLPNTAQFSDAERQLVTELPQDAPMGAVALVQYSYNERNIGSAYLYSASALEAARQESIAQEQQEDEPQETPAAVQPEQERGRFSLTAVLIPAAAVLVIGAAAGLSYYIYREKKREQEELARRRERRRQRLKESGMSEEEFERLRQARFGDKPGSRRRR